MHRGRLGGHLPLREEEPGVHHPLEVPQALLEWQALLVEWLSRVPLGLERERERHLGRRVMPRVSEMKQEKRGVGNDA